MPGMIDNIDLKDVLWLKDLPFSPTIHQEQSSQGILETTLTCGSGEGRKLSVGNSCCRVFIGLFTTDISFLLSSRVRGSLTSLRKEAELLTPEKGTHTKFKNS